VAGDDEQEECVTQVTERDVRRYHEQATAPEVAPAQVNVWKDTSDGKVYLITELPNGDTYRVEMTKV
jgi:hypothetical protein